MLGSIKGMFFVKMEKSRRIKRRIIMWTEFVLLAALLITGCCIAWKNSYDLMNSEPMTVFYAEESGGKVHFIIMNKEFYADLPQFAASDP